MPWQIEITRPALKDGADVSARDPDAIDRLGQDPGGADIVKLRGRADEWRLRVGHWRVRFEFIRASQTIRLLPVLHRREAYRD